MLKFIDFCFRILSCIIPKKYREKYFSFVKSEGILYIVFGVLTTIVSYASYIIMTRLFDADMYVSKTISWICAVTFAFITNKLYVFKSNAKLKGGLIWEIFSFYAARLLSLGIDQFLLWLLANPPFLLNDIVVLIISNIITLIVNYILSKLIIFRKTDPKNIEVKDNTHNNSL
ncbi:hypothetical protein SDC9_189904 [bioreactor metagenome]|uniref:GtrA/DPMS transmembrane domain-containing protein n=1 Tax=bioreactor metagenome TaxID=1076179 RepID=A0A645HTQ2_9ZZZZ|nr:GtrA family protein [Oscillospiraceae bacterium]